MRVLLLMGGYLVLTGYLLDSDYWKVLQCTKLKLPEGPSFAIYCSSSPILRWP